MEHILGYIILAVSLGLVATFLFCACVKKRPTGEEEKNEPPNEILEMRLKGFGDFDPR